MAKEPSAGESRAAVGPAAGLPRIGRGDERRDCHLDLLGEAGRLGGRKAFQELQPIRLAQFSRVAVPRPRPRGSVVVVKPANGTDEEAGCRRRWRHTQDDAPGGGGGYDGGYRHRSRFVEPLYAVRIGRCLPLGTRLEMAGSESSATIQLLLRRLPFPLPGRGGIVLAGVLHPQGTGPTGKPLGCCSRPRQHGT